MLILEVQRKTLFMKMVDLYPECQFLIEDEPQLYPLKCLVDQCHRNQNCMTTLAHRIKYIFDHFEEANLIVLYFKYRDAPKRQRAGVFWRDMREPRYIVMNPYAWEKLKSLGTIYEWTLPQDLFLKPQDLVQIRR